MVILGLLVSERVRALSAAPAAASPAQQRRTQEQCATLADSTLCTTQKRRFLDAPDTAGRSAAGFVLALTVAAVAVFFYLTTSYDNALNMVMVDLGRGDEEQHHRKPLQLSSCTIILAPLQVTLARRHTPVRTCMCAL